MDRLGNGCSRGTALRSAVLWAILLCALVGCGSTDSAGDGVAPPGVALPTPGPTPLPPALPPPATPVGTPAPVAMTGTGSVPPAQPMTPIEMGGAAGSGADMMVDPPMMQACTKGSTDGSDVAMIGDSYLALSGDITKVLQGLARDAGSLPPTAKYRTYYVSGTQLEGGFSPNIPQQFKNALAQGPIKTVIMTGGANDVLIGDPSCGNAPAPNGASCKNTIDTAAKAAADMLQEMAAAGVQDVIYLFYPHLPPGREGLNTSLDYGYTVTRPLCENATVRCHFIDQREAYAGHMEYFQWDNTHPTLAGSTVSAGLIWNVMKTECIAQ